MRIFLIGFMAAGKTTVGRELAARTGARFVDLDRVVADAEGASVAEIFARHGEAWFRRCESRALARLAASDEDRLVVATGGGAMDDEENRRLMARSGRVVWLDPHFEVMSERLEAAAAGERPLFRDREQARRLLKRRRDAYAEADLHLEIGADEGPRDVASRILDWLDEHQCAT